MIRSGRLALAVVVASIGLLGCPADREAPLRSRFAGMLSAEGEEYRAGLGAWWELPRDEVLPFLERVAAEAPTREERLLAEAIRLRIADEAARSRLVGEFLTRAETARESEYSSMHGGSRPADPELSVTGLRLLWPGETVPAPEFFATRWAAICNSVRLPDSPHWVPMLYEWAVKGWWETDAPTPPPMDFDVPPPPGVDPWSPPITGPPAPNGDVYVLFALELLAGRGERAVRDAVFHYLRTRTKYPLRIRRAARALDLLAAPEDADDLLAFVSDTTTPPFLRGLLLGTIGKVGGPGMIPSLRSLSENTGCADESWSTHIRVAALNALDAIERRSGSGEVR